MYLERIVTNFPKSDFRKQAEAALAQHGPAKLAGEQAKPQSDKQQKPLHPRGELITCHCWS